PSKRTKSAKQKARMATAPKRHPHGPFTHLPNYITRAPKPPGPHERTSRPHSPPATTPAVTANTHRPKPSRSRPKAGSSLREPDRAASPWASRSDAAIARNARRREGPQGPTPNEDAQPPHATTPATTATTRRPQRLRSRPKAGSSLREPDRAASPWASRSDAATARVPVEGRAAKARPPRELNKTLFDGCSSSA